MNRIELRLSILLLCGLLCPVARGQQITAKIGFMHFRQALQETNEVKAEIARVLQFVEEKNAESNRRLEELNGLREQLSAAGGTSDSQALEPLQTQVQKAETELKRFQEDTQEEIDRRRDSIFRTYGQKLHDLATEYAQTNGYTAVFLLDSSEYGYLDESVDLTKDIIAAYNQKYP